MTDKRPRLASVKDAAEYVGVSEKSIRRAYNDGRLTKYPWGRLVRVDLNEVDAVLGISA